MLVQSFMPFNTTSVFFCCISFVFSSKIKLFVLGLSFDFLAFCSFVFRLKSNLSSLGTVSFLFLVMLLGCGLWYLLSWRWLVWIII